MAKFLTMDSSIISLIVLTILYISASNYFNRLLTSYKLFLSLIRINIAIIIIDLLGWAFNGCGGYFFMLLNKAANLLLFIVVPIAPIVWYLYVDYQIFHEESNFFKVSKPLIFAFILNAAVSVISLFKGWYFYMDENNVYHRGDYFAIHLFICYFIILLSLLKILRNKDKIDRKYYKSLLLFYIPQAIGTIIQAHILRCFL